MNFDYKKLFSLAAIFFIFDECNGRNYEYESSRRSARMKSETESSGIVYPSDLLIRNNKRAFQGPYHSSFNRQPTVNQGYWNDYGYGPMEQNNIYQPFYDNTTQIPLDLIQRYNNFSEVNDLLLFVEGELDDDVPILGTRFNNEDAVQNPRNSAASIPKSANCMPEMQTVQIAGSSDPSVLYIPSCTRLERCGGCCSHSLLSCQPTEKEEVTFLVVKTQFQGGNKMKYMGKEALTVERHTKCHCQCRVQKEDCTSFQEYHKSECRCVCTNRDEEKKCMKENATKLWNSDACMCECRNITQCSTGYVFDIIQCRCVAVLMRRRFAEPQGEGNLSDKSEDYPLAPSQIQVKKVKSQQSVKN